MSGQTIGVVLDYARLAELHRPQDPALLAQEVRRLAATQDLTATDLSVALRIDLKQVREFLAAAPDEAARLHMEAWSK